ncbi:MAG: glycosyltransferase family 4 protein [Agathobacter sp.]
MNILIICNCASGLEIFRGMLIQELAKEGNTVSAIVPLVDNEKEWISEKQIEEMDCGLIRIPMERRGMNPLHDLKLLISYLRVIKREKPDLVITYTIKPNAYGGIACRLCHVPYAANITGLGTAFQNDGMLRRFVTILYKVALRKAKVVFFENAENQQVFLDAGIVRKEQVCLLNGAGVDLERFSYKPYPGDDSTTRFLFIGRVMKEKGVDEIFAAMRMLQKDGIHCSLDVLGGFDEDYSKQIENCENKGWLRYHGVQSDVRPFIANCHCFVLPSWHEGMANTNLECAASGRPVITSNIHGCMEAVEDGVTGFLCEKQNVESLYQVMKGFCELSQEEKQGLGRRGRERMEMYFDKKLVVQNTIRALDLER